VHAVGGRQRVHRKLIGAGHALVLEGAIAERLASNHARATHAPLALEAAERLATSTVHAVAVYLGVSDRHLRRVFHEAVGVSPKAFAKLARFRALVALRYEPGG